MWKKRKKETNLHSSKQLKFVGCCGCKGCDFITFEVLFLFLITFWKKKAQFLNILREFVISGLKEKNKQFYNKFRKYQFPKVSRSFIRYKMCYFILKSCNFEKKNQKQSKTLQFYKSCDFTIKWFFSNYSFVCGGFWEIWDLKQKNWSETDQWRDELITGGRVSSGIFISAGSCLFLRDVSQNAPWLRSLLLLPSSGRQISASLKCENVLCFWSEICFVQCRRNRHSQVTKSSKIKTLLILHFLYN